MDRLKNQLRRFRHARRRLLVAAILALSVSPAVAQVQRSYLNPSFEVPVLTASNNANGCYRQLDESLVPGWTTTHPAQGGSGDCVSPGASSGRLLELWRTNFSGVPARLGLNFVELNAEASSRLYQNVCLIGGEQIRWRFSHRGRGNATVRDVMDYNIGASQAIVRVGTTTTVRGPRRSCRRARRSRRRAAGTVGSITPASSTMSAHPV